MSLSLQQVLTEIDQLEPSEQISIMSHLIDRLNFYVTQATPKINQPTKIGRQELIGCARGLISMRADFDEPLADFQEYI
jgi:hypothetical protein